MNLQIKIKELIKQGVDPKKAVALAYSMQLQKAQYGTTVGQDPNANYYANNSPYFATNQQPWDLNRPDQTAYNEFQAQPQTGVQLDLSDNESMATNMDIYQNGEQLQRMQQNKMYNTATNNYDENGNAINTDVNKDYYSKLNIYNPYGGMGLDQSLFYAGQGFGEKDPLKATVGTGLSLLKGARGFLSGYSSAKASKESAENSYQQQFRPNTNAMYMQEGGYNIETDLDMYGLNTNPIVKGDLKNVERIQNYRGNGYGLQTSDVQNTLNNHSWYFDSEDKKNKFIEASKQQGGSDEIRKFQQAYNSELTNRMSSSNLSEEQKQKLYSEAAFTGKGVQGLDGKFGAFTSSRPIFDSTMPTQQAVSFEQSITNPTIPSASIAEKQKLYSIKLKAEDLSDSNRDFENYNINNYIKTKTSEQGGLYQKDIDYIQGIVDKHNINLEGRYNNAESKNNKKAQERLAKLRQSIETTEIKQEGGQFFGQETIFPIRKIEPTTNEQGVVGYTYYQGKLPTDAGYDPSLHKLFFSEYEHKSKQRPGSQDLYEPNLVNYLNKTDGKVNVRVKKEGGSIDRAEAMTGAYLTETEEAPTVELEKDEFTLNSQTGEIQKVVGEKHSNGGVKSDLPPGSQVISNYTKIGAKTAKELKDMFDISVKSKDTFAKVMDKIDAKIGYKETIEEETEYLKILEKQQSLDTNDVTKKLNEQHIAKELKENEDKKAELENKRIEAFQTLFEIQESRPKKGNGTEVLKKEGGNVYDPNILNLAKQYNLSPDRVIELMSEGGQTQQPDQMQQITQMIMESLQQGTSPEEVAQQLISMGVPSDQVMQLIEAVAQQMQAPQEEMQMAQEGGFTFSTRTTPKLQGYETEGVSILDQDTLSDVELMQPYTGKGYGAKMADVEKTMNIHKWYFDTEDKKNAFREAVLKEGEQPEVKMFQEAYNNEIENRAIRAGVPETDVKKIVQDVGFSKEGVKKLDGLFGAFTSTRPLYNFTKKDGEVKAVDVTPTEIDPTTNKPARGKDLGAKTVMANLPQDLLLPPSSLANLYKGEVRFGELDPIKMSAEAQLVEAERQRQTASKELYFLNPQQRAALMASGLGQTQMAANQAIGQAEMFNAQQKQQVDQFNLQNNMKEDLTNIELNKDFERRNLTGQGIYEANMRGFYNNLNAINRQNFADVRDLNLANAAFDKYQTDGSNIMFMPSDTVLNSQGTMKGITTEQYNKMTDAQKQAYLANSVYTPNKNG